MSDTFTHDMVRSALLRDDSGPFIVGEPIFIRTITYHLTGKIIAIKDKFLVLDEAAWIADDGRFTQAINEGILNEVEPVEGPVRVNIDSIVDAYHWAHPMPRKQK
jgi:hypothetical protein